MFIYIKVKDLFVMFVAPCYFILIREFSLLVVYKLKTGEIIASVNEILCCPAKYGIADRYPFLHSEA